MLLSDNFFMNGKILDSTEFYKFDFHEKIVTQKHLPLQAFATSTLRNTIGRRALVLDNGLNSYFLVIFSNQLLLKIQEIYYRYL